jgi:hypothetical protein
MAMLGATCSACCPPVFQCQQPVCRAGCPISSVSVTIDSQDYVENEVQYTQATNRNSKSSWVFPGSQFAGTHNLIYAGNNPKKFGLWQLPIGPCGDLLQVTVFDPNFNASFRADFEFKVPAWFGSGAIAPAEPFPNKTLTDYTCPPEGEFVRFVLRAFGSCSSNTWALLEPFGWTSGITSNFGTKRPFSLTGTVNIVDTF